MSGQDGARRVALPGFLQRQRRRRGGGSCLLCLLSFFPPPPEASSFPSSLHLRGRAGFSDTMSDSEEESQDRQLKVVVLGDGTSGKVSPPAGPPSQACKNPGAAPAPLHSSPNPGACRPGPPGGGRAGHEEGAW